MPSAEPSPAQHGRVVALDGLRGLAILSVMLFHQNAMIPATAFDRELNRLAVVLGSGVDLFFVLSGFLITGILYDAKGAAHYYRNFYVRRLLRIVPLYYAVLFAALVVLPCFPHPKLEKWNFLHGFDQVWYWLFLSNWSMALKTGGFRHGVIDLSWSLSIEEQFYLLWPLVVGWLDRRSLVRVCMALVVVGLGTRLAVVLAGAPLVWATLLTPARVDTLAIGAWIALAARGGSGIAPLVPAARRVAVLAAACVLGLYAGPGDAKLLAFLKPTVGPSVLAVLYGALLVLAAGNQSRGLVARMLSHRGLVLFGVYSYALYLFHNPIQAVIRDTLFRPAQFPTLFGSPLPGQLLFCIVATLPALGCAWLSWRLFEGPILSLKRYFPARAAPAPYDGQGRERVRSVPPLALEAAEPGKFSQAIDR
ncbi:MAG: acyltransferase [Isosphaeraceae bacterium]|nr:acyltransferase [Isosphaeraceae bacterium]